MFKFIWNLIVKFLTTVIENLSSKSQKTKEIELYEEIKVTIKNIADARKNNNAALFNQLNIRLRMLETQYYNLAGCEYPNLPDK